MKTVLFSVVLVLVVVPTATVSAQDTWSNGEFITHLNTPTQGEHESLVQNSLEMFLYGFSHDSEFSTRVADDLTVPDGERWAIDAITFYSLEALGYINDGFGPIPIDAIDVQIWDRAPFDTERVLIFSTTCTTAGGTLTSTWSNVYRVEDLLTGGTKAPTKQVNPRDIMANRCTARAVLEPGDYWVDWRVEHTDPFAVPIDPALAIPVTILGQVTTGNGLALIEQFGWGPAVDNGQQGFAFEVDGDFSGECEDLRRPRITSIGGGACGGNIEEMSPWLEWRDVDNDRGYRWELEDHTGATVASDTTGPNVTIANLGAIVQGAYTVRVQARGDGQTYCDSDWSDDCSFTVAGGVDESVDFTWWPEAPKQGEAARFADLTTGEPLSWFWDFGDGTTSDLEHPRHVYDKPGTYVVVRDVELESGHVIEEKVITVAGAVECGNGVCESGETAWSCTADCALPPDATGRAGGSDRRPTVPAAAGGLQGLEGSVWTTEAWVFNPGPDPAEFVMEFTARGSTEIAQAGPFTLDPEMTLYWDNVVEELFESKGSGALWVDSTVPVLFQTRTYTVAVGEKADSSPGSFGQAFTGTRDALTLGRGDGKLYLIGLREDDEFRSNLYFQEVDSQPITVQLEVFDNSGSILATDTFAIEGHSQAQKNLGIHLGLSQVSAAFATVEVTDGDGRLGAAGSVIDNLTGDPTSIDAIHPDQVVSVAKNSDVHTLVAAVAKNTGFFGSVWKSSLTINNPSPAAQFVRLVYEVDQDETDILLDTLETTVSIPAMQQRTWTNVLVQLFGVPANAATKGALHIYSPDGLMVSSRTYNQRQDGGTLGLGLPGLTAGDLVSNDGKLGRIVGLRHSANTRTNIGLAEYSGEETVVDVEIFSTFLQRFRLFGPETHMTPANSHLQLLKIFESVPGLEGQDLEGLEVEVNVKSGGSVYAYATVIDNLSGDPTTFTTTKD